MFGEGEGVVDTTAETVVSKELPGHPELEDVNLAAALNLSTSQSKEKRVAPPCLLCPGECSICPSGTGIWQRSCGLASIPEVHSEYIYHVDYIWCLDQESRALERDSKHLMWVP